MHNLGKSNPFVFFSAGESLTDKNRDINNDLEQIHQFFRPIDNLFGDYESRKKYGLERKIFRKLYSKSVNKKNINDLVNLIQPEVWRKMFKEINNKYITDLQIEGIDTSFNILDEETIILSCQEISKNKDKLLIIYLIYDDKIKDLVVDYEFIDSEEIRRNYDYKFIYKIYEIEGSLNSLNIKDGFENFAENFSSFAKNLMRNVKGNGNKIAQMFVIDPVKINEIASLCDARFNTKINNLGFGNISENPLINTIILTSILEIKKELLKKISSNENIWRITDTNVYDLFGKTITIKPKEYIQEAFSSLNKESNQSKSLIDKTIVNLKYYLAEKFCTRKLKLKDFEKFNFLRMRVGWEDGRYILFLHPYESESHNPIRIPGGQ